MSEFQKTDRTTITRLAKRGMYDKETVYSILDEALFCTLAYAGENGPFQIPTGFCRVDDKIYIHGSVGSFYMREIITKKLTVSIGATLIDGIVLARSAFHHSVNYRSVVVFGIPELVSDEHELYKALETFTEKMCPGRWNDIRQPNSKEWKATMVLSFKIEEASAKVRTGGPIDDDEDYAMDTWAGVLPLKIMKQELIPDAKATHTVEVPGYLLNHS